jgi:hypothetical protein
MSKLILCFALLGFAFDSAAQGGADSVMLMSWEWRTKSLILFDHGDFQNVIFNFQNESKKYKAKQNIFLGNKHEFEHFVNQSDSIIRNTKKKGNEKLFYDIGNVHDIQLVKLSFNYVFRLETANKQGYCYLSKRDIKQMRKGLLTMKTLE